MKRLVIYFHYDAAGRIDTACRIAVQAMQKHGEVLFVTNGTLAPPDRAWVRQSGAGLLERENSGYDVGAYKEALFTVGRDTLASYEEVILMNFTLAGPVCSLTPMFTAMEARPELDFWGLTRHYAMQSRRFGGHVPEHLQSHFLALRPSLFTGDDFWDYWRTMPLPKSYEESVIHHETRFTSYFAAKGYTWDSYVQTEDLKTIFINPIMACPRELLRDRACPFFKRRSFFTPYEDELRRTDGQASRALYEYLRTQTEFPVDLLLASLLQSQPLSVLAQNLHWHYLVDTSSEKKADPAELGLRLIRYEPLKTDPVAAWYDAQAAAWADSVLPQAAALFEQEPLLAVLSPSLPLWDSSFRNRQTAWKQSLPNLRDIAPVNTTPPPAPNCGWLLLRETAFPDGIPACRNQQEAWQLALTAQRNGYFSASMESFRQAAAQADILDIHTAAAQQPAAVAKQFGRLIKHKLQK